VRIIASTLTGNLTGLLQGSLALPIGVVSESVDNDEMVNKFVSGLLEGASAILPKVPTTTTPKPKKGAPAVLASSDQKVRPVILVQQQYEVKENPNDTLPGVEINEDNASLIAGPKPDTKANSSSSSDASNPASDLPSVSSYLLYLPNDAAENLAAGANVSSDPKQPTVAYVKNNKDNQVGISIHDLVNSLVAANNTNNANIAKANAATSTIKSTTIDSEEDDYKTSEEDEAEEDN